MRTFDTGATRDSAAGKLRYEGFLAPRVLRAYARYMHRHRRQRDGNLREPDNWQKGMPVPAYMDSLVRHVMDLWWEYREGKGLRVSLLCAVIFNASGLIYEVTRGSGHK